MGSVTRIQLEYELEQLVNLAASYKMGLFVNDITPDEDTTLADLVEASFDGYTNSYPPDGRVTPYPFSVPEWNAANNRAESSATPRVWTCTGLTTIETIYGYFWVDASDLLVLAVRRSPGGFAMDSIGQSFIVLAKRTLGNS